MLNEANYDKKKTEYLVQGFSEGFEIGYDGPTNRRDLAKNLPLSIGTHADIWEKIMKEVKLSRYAGPYEQIPFDTFIQSPIGLVPKDNGAKMRLIFHLSYDFKRNGVKTSNSVNHHTPVVKSSVKYNDIDHAVANCLELNRQYKAGLWNDIYKEIEFGDTEQPKLYFSKTDAVSAFRNLPIKPEHRRWLILKAYHPKTMKLYYFVDKCLPFGASISCAHFQNFSDALAHLANYHSRSIVGPERIIPLTNYLDDFLFIAFLRKLCNQLMSNFISICKAIGCPISEEKTVWASDSIVFLGMLLNGAFYTISIPQEKLLKALHCISKMIEKRKATIKELQQLTGLLNFFHRAIVPGRPFTRRMYDHIYMRNKHGQLLQAHHHIHLNKGFVGDAIVWKKFLNYALSNGQLICRPFIDWENCSINAVDIKFATDASANKNLGMGGVFGNRWIVMKWGKRLMKEKPSIEFLELYALAAGLLTWSNKITNCRVILMCDNQAVVHMVNSLTSKCPQCMKLIRLITLDGIIRNRRVFVQYIASKSNLLPDALSRLNFEKFWKYSKTMMKFPDTINNQIWPAEKNWFGEC